MTDDNTLTQREALNLAFDETIQSLATNSFVINKIINGNHFFVESYVTLNTGDNFYAQITTPSDKTIYLDWLIEGTGVLLTELYENPTGMTGGTSITPVNSNRQSSNTSNMTFLKDVTAPTDTGTTISSVKFGVDGNAWRIKGGSSEQPELLILKKNTTYCRKFSSESDNNIVHFFAHWIEE